MAFKASKTRQRREAEPLGRGVAIVPSAGIRIWYEKEMRAVVKAMVADYREKVGEALKKRPVKKAFAEDASASEVLNRTLSLLSTRWDKIFAGFAKKVSGEFVNKTEKAATTATLYSLSVAGLKEPKAQYSESVKNTLEAEVSFNHTLITNISVEVHEKIHSAVMLSLTSPDPEKQGMSGIESALKEVGTFADNKVALIARDQTSKLYSSLSDARMEENGCEEFEWQHSSAGKTQRHDHVEKNGQIFKLNDPRLWTGKKSDQGPPGWAINCRCRRIPVFR